MTLSTMPKKKNIYESFSEIFKDQYINEKEVCWLKKRHHK